MTKLMPQLRISETKSLLLDAFLTSTQGILAKKGSGKSHTAVVQAEELLAAGQQVVVIDPTGCWYGLRSSKDGTKAGWPIPVFGGDHADVPLEPTSGELIAEAVATEHFSAILDLSLLRKGEANRFVGAFLETLYRKNRDALHAFIDEADLFAPQRPFGDESRTLSAAEDVVRRGRIRGIGCTLITQRAAVLNKNVLSQVDMLTCLRMSHPKDLVAIREWVDVKADVAQAKEMIVSLPGLPIGDAWLWAPASDLFERVKIRDRWTFDSGRTPRAGERAVSAKVLAPIDIARLGRAIAETKEQASARDPAALRKRVAELEQALRDREPNITPEIERLTEVRGRIDQLGLEVDALIVALVKGSSTHPGYQSSDSPQTGRSESGSTRRELAGSERRSRGVTAGETAPLPRGEAAVLTAVLNYRANGLSRAQLTVLTGYKRASRDAYIARLRDRGLVSVGDRIVATDAGARALPEATPLPTGDRLRALVMSRLPAGERAVLEVLIRYHPGDVARSFLDAQTGYKRASRDAYLARLAARELITLTRGHARASDNLF